MTQIAVEPQVLEALAEELAGVAAALSGDTGLLAEASAVATDEPGLVAALDGLAVAWRDGLARLAEQAASTADAVREAGRCYADVERALAGARR